MFSSSLPASPHTMVDRGQPGWLGQNSCSNTSYTSLLHPPAHLSPARDRVNLAGWHSNNSNCKHSAEFLALYKNLCDDRVQCPCNLQPLCGPSGNSYVLLPSSCIHSCNCHSLQGLLPLLSHPMMQPSCLYRYRCTAADASINA
jgi:hypothetical protein